MEVRQILCPIDFSTHSVFANDYASQLAKSTGAKIYYLHVVDTTAPYDASFECHVPSDCDLDDEQDELLTIAPTCDGIEHQHVSMVGRPVEVILDFIRKHDVDLVIMGTHGRTGVARLAMGSVAESVLRQANCTVATIKPPVGATCVA